MPWWFWSFCIEPIIGLGLMVLMAIAMICYWIVAWVQICKAQRKLRKERLENDKRRT